MTKETDHWNTPKWIQEIFKFGFFDPCPNNPEFDGLKESWRTHAYVNPPYSNPMPWVEKAIEESKKGCYVVMLLKCDPSTKWYKKIVEAKAHFIFFGERLHYSESKQSPNFPSVLIVLNGIK